MKTAISIPDDVFEEAERLARRMGKSRSRLYQHALAEYVARHAPGNVLLSAHLTGLPKDSVVNVSRIVTLDIVLLTECAGKLQRAKLQLVLSGIDVVLGR